MTEVIAFDVNEATAMVNRMSSLPAHPEVPGALRRLRSTALKVVALVNSLESFTQVQEQIPRLLSGPGPGRVGGNAEDVDEPSHATAAGPRLPQPWPRIAASAIDSSMDARS
jgi:hypothetical protein